MNIQEMMKQAKLMQDRMKQVQTRLESLEVTGTSGGGMVAVTMNCKGDVKKVEISPDVIDPQEKETLEDLVKAAINSARTNSDQLIQEETAKMMSEFGLPSDTGFPGL